MKGVPVVRGSVVWIDLECATMLTFGHGPIEVMTGSREAQRAVSLGGSRVQFDCFGRVLFGGG